jgi:hypothetical protein
MPGLLVAPKALVVLDPKPPPLPPNRVWFVDGVVEVDPKVLGLFPVLKMEAPPKGEDVEAVLAPNPPPKPVLLAVAVDEPKRPPPLVVVAVPKAGFAPNALLV